MMSAKKKACTKAPADNSIPAGDSKHKSSEFDALELRRVTGTSTSETNSRYQINGYVPIGNGMRRVHVLTLTSASWGKSYHIDGLKFLEFCKTNAGCTRHQAVMYRDAMYA